MKVLIYMSESDLKPIGGAGGYLYQLKDGLSKLDDKGVKICFLPPIEKTKNSFSFKDFMFNVRKFKLLNIIINYLLTLKLIFSFGKSSNIDFSDFDIIHFHRTMDYYICRNNLKNFKGKIILTSHCPMPFHKEYMIESGISSKFLLNKLKKIDRFAFNHTNYILFPCKEAEEPYYNQRDEYAKIHKENHDKYIYLPTGLIPLKVNKSKNDLRKEYGFNENDFIVCYVGRHNEVKGYNSLKKLGKLYLEKNEKAYFLIAGKESPIKGINHKRWKEIGWTDKPYEVVECSDVFILPNKETYFDLVLLEVLSLGKPIILTRTGGNKYFEQFKDSGLFFYDYNNYEQFYSILENLSNGNLDEIGLRNKKLFNNNFNSKIFAENYLNLYKNIGIH